METKKSKGFLKYILQLQPVANLTENIKSFKNGAYLKMEYQYL